MTKEATEKRSQIGLRLRQARESAGLSQGQVAKIIGFHRPTISEIEAGRRRVSADELLQLVKIYGVGIDWVISDDDSNDGADDRRIQLAARQLSKMDDDDLERLMTAIRMLRKSENV